MKKRYPIGTQNFDKLRLGDYLYIDKTALVYQIVTSGAYYFLADILYEWKVEG